MRTLRLDSCCILLPLSLIPKLIVYVRVQTRDLIVIDEDCDLALSISQLLPLLLHLLPRAEGLGKGLVLNQNIGPLCWKFISLHLDVSNVTVSAENGGEVLLVCVLRIITNRCV